MADEPSIQEELTAYLDGELNAEAASRIEERLARDAAYRQELQRLERAWDLLDELPRAQVDPAFSTTTLEMVTSAAVQEAVVSRATAPRLRVRRWALTGAALVAAGLGGIVTGRLIWPNPNRQLLEDLPVLEDLDMYEHADSVDFLRQLDREKVFEEDLDHAI